MTYRVIRCVRTCIAMPAQWEAETEDGRRVYIRHRWGCGEARISEPGGDLPVFSGTRLTHWDDGTPLGGDLTADQMVALTSECLDWSGCEFAIDPGMQDWAKQDGVER